VHTSLTLGDSAFQLEIYTKKGTFLGFENDSSSWTKICCRSTVMGMGPMSRSPVLEAMFYSNVLIAKGEIQSFYVTSKNADLLYTPSGGPSRNDHEGSWNYDLRVLGGGVGVMGYPFGTAVADREWNGVIHYNVNKVSFLSSSLSNSDEYQNMITPTFTGENTAYGFMFDIVTKDSPITIKTLSFHTDLIQPDIRVFVWYKRGTHVGHEQMPESWELLSDTIVRGERYLHRTPIPPEFFKDVKVNANERVALYISLTTPNLRYSNVSPSGNKSGSENENLIIMHGKSVLSTSFGLNSNQKKEWNGSIQYMVHEANIGPAPLLLPAGNNDVSLSGLTGGVTTSYAGGNGGRGAMFDVFAKGEMPGFGGIVVTSIDFHTDSTSDDIGVRVYTCQGSFMNHAYDSKAWKLVADTKVTGRGPFKKTGIVESVFDQVYIPAEQVQAFYVSLDRPNLLYSDVPETVVVRKVWSQSEDVEVTVGAGLGYSMEFTGLQEPRLWNGSIRYSVADIVTTAPTPRFTRGPTPPPFSAVVVTSNPTGRTPTASPTSRPTKAVIVTPTVPSQITWPVVYRSLATTFAGGNGSFGNLFNLIAPSGKGGITVTNLDLHTDHPGKDLQVEVWTRNGPFEEGTQSVQCCGWTLLVRTTVVGVARHEPTSIPSNEFPPVNVQPGETRGFLVTFDTDDMRYTNYEENEDLQYAANDDLVQITVGAGVSEYPFRGRIVPNRMWNGRVFYRSPIG